jgi:hypothetical protein
VKRISPLLSDRQQRRAGVERPPGTLVSTVNVHVPEASLVLECVPGAYQPPSAALLIDTLLVVVSTGDYLGRRVHADRDPDRPAATTRDDRARGSLYTVRWAVSAGTRRTSKVTQVTLN